MRETWDMKRLSDVRGKDVWSSDGEKIGSIQEIYYDDVTGSPEWVGLGTGFLGMKKRVVPVENLMPEGDHYTVPWSKTKVQEEPDWDAEGDSLSTQDEQVLCGYFGVTGEHSHSTRLLRPGEDYRGPML